MPFIQRNSISSFFTTSPFIISFLIGCLYIAMRLWRLNDYGLWLDEVFSVNMARLDWKEILPAVAHDIVHPPLFYLLLKMWIHLGGESLFWLRFFPALTAIATIIPFFSICRELRLSTTEINTAFILISVNSYLIYYAQESRMYSLLLFFTLCSMYLFIRIIIGNGTSKILLPSLFSVNLLLIYTHYFGWLIVGVECIYILILRRRQLLSFVIIIAALAVCFAPWAYMVGYVATEKHGLSENISWIGRPRLYNLTWYYAALHGTFDVRKLPALSLVFFTYPFLLWTWRVLRGETIAHRSAFLMLSLFSFFPVIFVFAASHILPQSIWVDRYLIISSVPYIILLAMAMYRLPHVQVRVIITYIIINWALVSNFYAITREDRKIRWDKLTHTIMHVESAQANTVRIYTFEEFVASPFRFSLELSKKPRFDIIVANDIAELHETRFWVAFRQIKWQGENSPQAILKGAGCRIAHETYDNDRSQKVTLFSADCNK